VPDMPTTSRRAATIYRLDPADFKGRVMEVREAVQKQKRIMGHTQGNGLFSAIR